MKPALLAPPLLLFALPIAAALPTAIAQGIDATAWTAIATDPQLPLALVVSLTTGLTSTLLSLALTLLIVTHLHGTRAWNALTRTLGPLLALPHAAFAIGLALLVMPAGLIARLVAPLAGYAAPPDWPTVQDPFGLGLVLVLVGKEAPFLLWHAVALFARPEVALQMKGQIATGRTLGYRDAAIWWRVLWPQWLPRLAWPVVAVLAYGLTVVDLALIVGPTSPPTLAQLAWQSLQDGDVQRNAEGAAMALLLAGVLALIVGAGAGLAQTLRAAALRRATRGDRPAHATPMPAIARVAALALSATYAVVAGLLFFSSLAGVWTFPALLPASWTASAWQQVAASSHTLALSAGLGAVAAFAALALVLLWLEAAPARWDRHATPFVLAPLLVPSLLWSVGLYTLALRGSLDGTVAGLAWAHALMAVPYVFVALAPAWRSFDPRYETTALALGRSRLAFWWQVKRPMLAAPLAAALAVGFAVSIAQYLPTQFIGAGRHATVTTEAVTLAAGGQRSGAAAFALLQALLPAAGFALAAAVGARQRKTMRADA